MAEHLRAMFTVLAVAALLLSVSDDYFDYKKYEIDHEVNVCISDKSVKVKK